MMDVTDIAILLRALPLQDREELLQCLGGEEQMRLREILDCESTISPGETDRVVGLFFDSLSSATFPDQAADRDLSLDACEIRVFSPQDSERPPTSGAGSIPDPRDPIDALLDSISDERLAAYLEGEHPQVSALLLKSMPPRRVDHISEHLRIGLRVDLKNRMPQSMPIDPELIHAIRCEFIHELTETAKS